MFLSQMTLYGFKSFAERSVIEFDQGLQVIVGPNGCGKSNIIDAVQWVCGEQALKNLRVEKSEDIIFGGTAEQKALNVAEVELVFDNQSGILPMKTNTVSVSRRLYRSGENHYFVNGQQVLLRDLWDMLGHASLGKSLYSVLAQGNVDKILSSKPDQRRGMFDDAAGISRYRLHSHEILQRLRAAEENIDRAEQLQKHTQKRVSVLAGQVKNTKQHRTLQEKLFTYEKKLELQRLKELEEVAAKAREALKTISASCTELEEQVSKSEEIHERISKEVKEYYGYSESLKQEISDQRVLEGRLDEQVSMLKQQIRHFNKQKGITSVQSEQAAQYVQQISNTLEKLEETQNANREQEQNLQEEQKKISKEIENLKKRIKDKRHGQQECMQTIKEHEEERSNLQHELTELAEQLAVFIDSGLREYSHKDRIALEKDIDSHLERLKTAFVDANGDTNNSITMLKELKKLIAKHRVSIPFFLSQLTSPGGTITRKREIDAHVTVLHQNIIQLQNKTQILGQEIESLNNARATKEQELFSSQKDHVRISSEIKQQNESVKRILQDSKRANKQLTEIEKNQESLSKQVDTLEEQIQSLIAAKSNEGKKIHELLGKNKVVQEKINKHNRMMQGTDRERKRSIQQLEQERRKSEQVRVTLAELQSKIESIHEYFREKHGYELSEDTSRVMNRTKAQIQEDILNTKQALTALGSVNFKAQEEYDSESEKLAFLDKQLEDLYKAKENLEEIGRQVQEKSSAQFMSSFEAIRKHFKIVFKKLFGGGNCDIRLMEPDKVLESGIEILALPSGKKLKSINLLSGGERSMTALALIFAIYMQRPAPFTCFDEVDAMLDNNNTVLFSQILKEFSQLSQFIVVTHNERTCTYADSMVGITMQKPGISTVLSASLATQSEH